MTRAVLPADFRPVIALFCTRGMETFLSNAIQGILQLGIDPGQIHVGCPNNALGSVKSVTALHSAEIQVVSTQKLSENEAALDDYSSFGSRSFTDISWKKIFFIRELIELHPHVVYADLDISWIRNPLPYLSEVASVYPIAIQTEGLPRFPPAFCCGFASFITSERAIAFLDALIEFDAAQLDSEKRLDDQVVCQQLVENDVTWLRDIYCLPEALFLNGLGYRNLQKAENPCPMEAELLPFLFHANWTVGIDNKRKLLAGTGTWFLADPLQNGQTTKARSGPAEIKSGIQRRPETHPLLTVIYPVFDVRGDTVERVRLWTEAQDFDSRGYRVLVVAGIETELDEAALRKVLRVQDAILRVPGAGREADYWNAGAAKTTTPWLLFVEGHGMPEPDSVSALAAWIAANPNGEACNFRIRNAEDHRIARLMKRWFTETQIHWTDPSTWRRLHRTAFAMRRDVFNDVGPFEAAYGQFAPPLLSARMRQRGLTISALPTSSIMHDDAPEISIHHEDTADYVRGEMDARAVNDATFFETYFGPSPRQGPDMILAARDARGMIGGLVTAALHRPREAIDRLGQAFALLPAALLSLQGRAKLLAAATRADEGLVMRLPLAEGARWKRFRRAHRRLVRTERMRWIARHPPLPLQTETGERKWPATAIGQHAIIGLHALEYFDGAAFRWTHPVFLLRLALTTEGVLTLETRNLRSQIGLSHIVVVVAGRILSSGEIELDDIGNIKLKVRPPPASQGEADIVVIVRTLSEPSVERRPGRRLGLPLFSVIFQRDDPETLRRDAKTV